MQTVIASAVMALIGAAALVHWTKGARDDESLLYLSVALAAFFLSASTLYGALPKDQVPPPFADASPLGPAASIPTTDPAKYAQLDAREKRLNAMEDRLAAKERRLNDDLDDGALREQRRFVRVTRLRNWIFAGNVDVIDLQVEVQMNGKMYPAKTDLCVHAEGLQAIKPQDHPSGKPATAWANPTGDYDDPGICLSLNDGVGLYRIKVYATKQTALKFARRQVAYDLTKSQGSKS